jgi:hypothetical protein
MIDNNKETCEPSYNFKQELFSDLINLADYFPEAQKEIDRRIEEFKQRKTTPQDKAIKSDGYVATAGMKTAAQRAIDWREQGHKGGTVIGATRARQIVSGEKMSDETVKRMFSFFSRHEVDKKATGFNSGEDGFPSAGRVAWDLWGGDAGFSWSRQITERLKREEKS